MLTNNQIDSFIQLLQADTEKLDSELDDSLDKKERNAVFKRHGFLERTIKLLYLLKQYD
jgi:hypothetical protein